jgi:hypothetical protein
MTEVPKIVYDRLRAVRTLPYGPQGQEHPDSDLLTAFAERSLSATERDGVLHHLAGCGECREIIALALPAAEIPPLPFTADSEAREPQHSAAGQTARLASIKPAWLKLGALNFGYGSGLRWAALAAGVVVAAAVLALYPGRSGRQVATNTLPANAQIAPPNAPASTVASSPATSLGTSMQSAEVQQQSGLRQSQSAKSGSIPVGKHLDELKRRSADSHTVPTLEVTSQFTTADTLMARNDAPAIEKAKPALPGAEAQSASSDDQKNGQSGVQPGLQLKKQMHEGDTTSTATSASSPSALAGARTAPAAKMALAMNEASILHEIQWTVAGGALQRSLDGGQSWQDSLHPSHPLLCYASHGEDTWAGGQAGTLFHSSNGGMTWEQVHPSSNSQQLSSDITHIDLQGDVPATAKIAVTTGSKETWISVDGGKTWEKK